MGARAAFVCGGLWVGILGAAMAEPTTVYCQYTSTYDGEKGEYKVQWDDADKSNIRVDDLPVPRTSKGGYQYTLDKHSPVSISWCVSKNRMRCATINRRNGQFEEYSITSGRVTETGECTKAAPGTTKF